jgi:hypothetical protein
MDKLELDDRVARLERRVSLLLAMPFVIIALLVLAAMSMAFLRRADESAAPPMPTPAAVTVEDDRSMQRLDGDLRKLHGLLNENLIDRDDFQAKKKVLFAPLLHVTDFASGMQLARKLLDENIIDRGEYEQLKKKILEIGG